MLTVATKIIQEGLEACPLPIQSVSLNLKNHLEAIKEYGLGPADPREPNTEFWIDKSKKWNCSEGDARSRLCANCGFYVNATPIKECIAAYPVKDMKASDLPVTPQWADIESTPQAYCTALDITCSPVRTCDIQKMGGPIDDDKLSLPKYANILDESDEYDE